MLKKTRKTASFLGFAIFSLLFSSCDYVDQKLNNYYTKQNTKETEAPVDSNGVLNDYYEDGSVMNEVSFTEGKRDGKMVSYYKNGNVRSEVDYVKGMKHGKSIQYYKDGNVNMEFDYVNGKKEGMARWYYTSGELYEECPYKDDEMHGIKKRFSKEGVVKHEIPYKEGKPGIGLMELDKKGNVITNYPEIIVKGIDKMAFENTYIIELSLSKKVKDVQFYEGPLEDGKYFDELKVKFIQTEDKVGRINVFVAPRSFEMRQMNFIAVTTSSIGNPLIITKAYNLAVENVQ